MRIKYELFVNGKYILSTWLNSVAFEQWQWWSEICPGNVRLKFRRVAA